MKEIKTKNMPKEETIHEIFDRSVTDSEFRRKLFTQPELVIQEYPDLKNSEKQTLLGLKIQKKLTKK